MNLGYQKIKLIYYTDPICSTCWTFEPYLFKFLKCYDAFVEVEYRMGGLVQNWDELPNFSKRKNNAEFLKDLWESERARFEIGIDTSIWEKGGIPSSYPACIAYYASLEQGKEVAEIFLRNMRSFVFLCGKNIGNEHVLTTCAIESGLNIGKYKKAIESGSAELAFKQHLIEKENDHVKHFPSFVLQDQYGEKRKILNITDYAFFDEVLVKLDTYLQDLTGGRVFKKRQYLSPIQLIHKYSFLSLKQLETICEQGKEDIESELKNAVDQGHLICEWHEGIPHYKLNDTPFQIKKVVSKDTVAIIGGGICGGFLKHALDKTGTDSKVYERTMSPENRGFGFLLLQNGIEALDALGLKNELFKQGNHMNFFKAVTPDGSILFEKNLENCIAISREGLKEMFFSRVSKSDVHFGKVFCEFSKSEEQFSKVQFSDGSSATADVFVGVDGVRSSVRNEVFGESDLKEVGEREIVCAVDVHGLDFQLDEFYKVIDGEHGKSIGVIPLSEEKYIWFLQVNHVIDPCDHADAQSLKAYTMRSVENFPEKIKALISASNFENAFLWISQRMDHLPAYSKGNCLLMGDAAHPLLPLTSQGANSALEDAATFASIWSAERANSDVKAIFKKYEALRRPIIAHFIHDGDALAEDFMQLSKSKKFKLPLTIH